MDVVLRFEVERDVTQRIQGAQNTRIVLDVQSQWQRKGNGFIVGFEANIAEFGGFEPHVVAIVKAVVVEKHPLQLFVEGTLQIGNFQLDGNVQNRAFFIRLRCIQLHRWFYFALGLTGQCCGQKNEQSNSFKGFHRYHFCC